MAGMLPASAQQIELGQEIARKRQADTGNYKQLLIGIELLFPHILQVRSAALPEVARCQRLRSNHSFI